ncbi:hypothetical protein BDW_06405 [Bdellovibrio bacteriovorus W]|nr:hypothetical protein BDW_06405 [Bdellovibrio bacteriovorus W]
MNAVMSKEDGKFATPEGGSLKFGGERFREQAHSLPEAFSYSSNLLVNIIRS